MTMGLTHRSRLINPVLPADVSGGCSSVLLHPSQPWYAYCCSGCLPRGLCLASHHRAPLKDVRLSESLLTLGTVLWILRVYSSSFTRWTCLTTSTNYNQKIHFRSGSLWCDDPGVLQGRAWSSYSDGLDKGTDQRRSTTVCSLLFVRLNSSWKDNQVLGYFQMENWSRQQSRVSWRVGSACDTCGQ